MTGLKVIAGDCVETMAAMETRSFGVVVTSPPYNIGMGYASYDDRRPDYIAWSMTWIEQAMRVSRSGVMLNIGSKPSDQNQLYRLLGAIAERWTIQNSFVWVKSIAGAGSEGTIGQFKPVQSARYVNQCHELILHVVEEPTAFDRRAIGVPFDHKSNIARRGHSEDRRCRGSTWLVPYETRQRRLEHPASYPVRLAEMMIAPFEGAVLDPFVGSGTTLRAAWRLGRACTGIEIDPEYVGLSRTVIAECMQEESPNGKAL